MNQTSLEELGFNNFFKNNQTKLGFENFLMARVVAEHKGAYEVKSANGEYFAKVTGKQMFEASSREDYPAVGDWVAITDLDGENATINYILPRMTILKRSRADSAQIIATNIDFAFIVESIDRDFSLNRFERYIVIANDGGVKPVIVLNKTDLISKEVLDQKLSEIENRFKEIEIVATSSVNNEGLQELKNYIKKSKTYCFLGSSGVGKSSLVNKLLGDEKIKTDNISAVTGRGKHTTTERQMYFLDNGGIVIDNPGMREVGMTNTGASVDNFFDEINTLAQGCKFADCTHVHEPDCTVLKALNSGELDAEKYSNYINLKKEAKHYESTELERREKDREFGKFMKTAKKQLRKRKEM